MNPTTLPTISEILGPEGAGDVVSRLLFEGASPMGNATRLEGEKFLRDGFLRNPAALAVLLGRIGGAHPGLASLLLQEAASMVHQAADHEKLRVLGRPFGVTLSGDVQTTDELKQLTATAAQKDAVKRLRRIAHVYFTQPYLHGIKLRTIPLVIGPSGVGKTYLAAELARQLSLPVFKVTVGDWLPQGVNRETPTLNRLRDFQKRHTRYVLHIDEIDKLRATEGVWILTVMTEIFTVLDRQIGPAFSAEQLADFQKNVFIIGSGTWQDLWDGQGPKNMGFGARTTDRIGAIRDRIRAGRIIPPELLNRHNDAWFVLPPYTAEDFRQIATNLRLPEGIVDPESAASSGLNFRYIEGRLTEHAIANCSL